MKNRIYLLLCVLLTFAFVLNGYIIAEYFAGRSASTPTFGAALPENAPLFQDLPEVGKFNAPNLERVKYAEIYGTKLTFSSEFSTDSWGRRVTPQNAQTFNGSTLFFGCSFTFGRGVGDSETLPKYFADQMPSRRVYNYGVSAGGPHQMLAWLESGSLERSVTEPVREIVYVFIPSHYYRITGGLYEDQRLPAYVFENGEVHRLGIFKDVHPIRARIFEWLKKSSFVRRPSGLLREWFWSGDQKLFCEILAKSKTLSQEKFPGSRFVILSHGLWMSDHPLMGALKSCAQEKGIELVEYIPRHSPEESYIDPEFDNHPSALIHRESAEVLARALGQ